MVRNSGTALLLHAPTAEFGHPWRGVHALRVSVRETSQAAMTATCAALVPGYFCLPYLLSVFPSTQTLLRSLGNDDLKSP